MSVFKLGKVCDVLNGRAYSQNELLAEGKYPVLRVGNFFSSDKWYYSDMELPAEKYCDKGDLLFAWSASFGPRIWSGGKVIYHYHIWKLVPNSKILDKTYLYYWLLDSVARITAGTHGSVMAHMTKADMETQPIDLPNIETQRKIASVLSSIDGKIELNNSINKNLEGQAKAIFSQRIALFDSIPNGWKETSLDSIADYLNGLAMQKFPPKEGEEGLPVLKIAELKQGFCDASSNRCTEQLRPQYIVNDGDVIFSWSASLVVDFWCGGRAGLNQHLFKVTSKRHEKWFYYWWTKYHLNEFIHEANSKATTMGHITRDRLTNAKVLIPDEKTYREVGDLMESLDGQIIAKRLENKKLAELRKTLLPKLISGEIDVSEVEVD